MVQDKYSFIETDKASDILIHIIPQIYLSITIGLILTLYYLLIRDKIRECTCGIIMISISHQMLGYGLYYVRESIISKYLLFILMIDHVS